MPEATALLAADGMGVWVSISQVEGSAPREEGSGMLVTVRGTVGSVGGGHLEWEATARARQMLEAVIAGDKIASPTVATWALGPALGQCCGGRVALSFSLLQHPSDTEQLSRGFGEPHTDVVAFGAGHVGHALAHALGPLPFRLTMVDSRAQALESLQASARGSHGRLLLEEEEQPDTLVAHLPSGGAVLVMTHSHAQDFDILLACLRRQQEHGDLAWIGMIGSRSKWAGFSGRLRERGIRDAVITQVHCPVGMTDRIKGKSPAVIAASIAAQWLAVHPLHAAM